jgi:hypothetical protein
MAAQLLPQVIVTALPQAAMADTVLGAIGMELALARPLLQLPDTAPVAMAALAELLGVRLIDTEVDRLTERGTTRLILRVSSSFSGMLLSASHNNKAKGSRQATRPTIFSRALGRSRIKSRKRRPHVTNMHPVQTTVKAKATVNPTRIASSRRRSKRRRIFKLRNKKSGLSNNKMCLAQGTHCESPNRPKKQVARRWHGLGNRVNGSTTQSAIWTLHPTRISSLWPCPCY